jgi:hypothetical protein
MKNDGSIQENEGQNPGKIFETCFAFAPSRVLLTGVELEIFTDIANGNFTAPDIAKATGASPRGTGILLNSLVALNFLTKSDGEYGLIPLAEKFLVKGNPAYYGDFALNVDLMWEPRRNLM